MNLLTPDPVEAADDCEGNDDGCEDSSSGQEGVEEVPQGWGDGCLSDQGVDHGCSEGADDCSGDCGRGDLGLGLGAAQEDGRRKRKG